MGEIVVMKKIILLRILFVVSFVFLLFAGLTHIKPVEAGILSAILTDSQEDKLLMSLSDKYSSRINILFESDDYDSIEDAKEEFLEELDKSKLKMDDYSTILDDYKQYPHNFLTPQTRQLLKEKKYDIFEKQSLEKLYNPMGITILAPNEDPFVVFSEYLMSLKGNSYSESELIEHGGKYYEFVTLDFKKEIAHSTELLNVEMAKIVKLQEKLSKKSDNKDTKIYITGVPIHSYNASSKSILEINLICILSSLFVISLCYFYFRSAKILIPILSSIGFGVLCGFLATTLVFPKIHILTFVFSTTLIGICLDYSLHYFVESDSSKISKALAKSLAVSIIAAVGAFLALLFSNVGLLKQIAVFTSAGLLSVYLLVVLFFPLIKLNIAIPKRKLNFSLDSNKKLNIILAVIFCGVLFAGMYNMKFNDDIRSMYTPTKNLANAEKLFYEVSKMPTNVSFLTVKSANIADNIEHLMQREEEVAEILNDAGIKYISLSKFIPSQKLQNENQQLIKTIYETRLDSYASFLNAGDKKQGKERLSKNLGKFLIYDKEKQPYFSEFLINEGSPSPASLMILYDVKSPEIFNKMGNVSYINPQKDISCEMKKCRKSCLKLLIPLFISLFVLLALLHKPKNAVILVLPPVLGVMFSFAILSLLGQSINLFHVLSAFLIVGFSIDYSVFRFNNGKNSNDALFISALTSMFSFLLLSLTSFKLISSIGFVLFVGLLTSYILSLFLISED